MATKAGTARIVRIDAHNVAVEVLTEIEESEKGADGKRVKTGGTRLEWQERGYYGHRLEWAAESALFEAMPQDKPITKEMIRDAVKEIVAATKDSLRA